MLHKTRAIVLRTIRYGETSLICHVFTELLGLQSYLIKGARSPRKRGQQAGILHPAAELDMVVYHQPHKNLQAVKEYQASAVKPQLHQDIVRNCIALFSMEVLMQFLTQDDPQPELFSFSTDFLQELSALPPDRISNLPLFFLIQAGRLSGYQLSGTCNEDTPYLDLQEGRFCRTPGSAPSLIEGTEARLMSLFNQGDITAVTGINVDNGMRRSLLQRFLFFFRMHAPHFRELKSLPVLTAILSE